MVIDVCYCSVDCFLRRNRASLDRLALVSLTFVEQEEKGFVFEDRPANIGMELVVVDRRRLHSPGPWQLSVL